MLDDLLPFFAVGVAVELAVLPFMLFRAARGSCMAQLVFAFFAFFAGLMALLVIAGLAEGPVPFTDKARTAFPGAFVILALLIVAAKRSVPATAATPRKRPLILDMIGCAVLGVLVLVALIAGTVMLIMLAR